MAFTPDQLLLTPERRAQLERALAGPAELDPLATLCAEAEAEVQRLAAGYALPAAVATAWTRTLALYAAHLAAGGGVPEALRQAHDAVRAELTAIAHGQRPNLPADPAPATVWGSQPALAFPRAAA